MNKGLFIVACLAAACVLSASGCAQQQPPPMAPAPLDAPPAFTSERATTTDQMASVGNMMKASPAAPRQPAAGEFITGADILGRPPEPKASPDRPARSQPPAPPARPVKAAAARAAPAKAPAKSAPSKAALAKAPAADKPPAARPKVGHGSLVSKSGTASTGTLTVDPDGSAPKTSYALTRSTYIEKVVEGGKFGKDLRSRGSWADLAAGKRVWFTFTGGKTPTLASIATFIFPKTQADYDRYQKVFAAGRKG